MGGGAQDAEDQHVWILEEFSGSVKQKSKLLIWNGLSDFLRTGVDDFLFRKVGEMHGRRGLQFPENASFAPGQMRE
jgi:hypothetical protein